MQIPKVIHYCWFGRKPLPSKAVKCINSWKKLCPDYEIIQWNEDNFDFSSCDYSREAYEVGKYAFVSDYARFKILNSYGGIYFDTDVELIKPIDSILRQGPFMACEQNGEDGIAVAPGLGMASVKDSRLLRDLMNEYLTRKFIRDDGTYNQITIVEYTTELLKRHGLRDVPGIQFVGEYAIYPKDYFAPKDPITGKIRITDNTVSIHHYDSSWYTPYQKFADRMSHILGQGMTERIVKAKKKILKKQGQK